MASGPDHIMEIEDDAETMPSSFCGCWQPSNETEPGNPDCGCGEEIDVIDWHWKIPENAETWVELGEDQKQVTFHPVISSGTAVVRGSANMYRNHHYYWEVKMLTEPYGTDVMVGIGSQKVNLLDTVFDYRSFLGSTEDSYGLSYTGAVCRNNMVILDLPGFCMGTIIGVRVDLFRGTLEFYLNRKPQGIVSSDLLRHEMLYPMLSSTSAQTSLRLVYATSWKDSLVIDAAKVLAESSANANFLDCLPPGLANTFRRYFWMIMPSAGEEDADIPDEVKADRLPTAAKKKHWRRRW